MAVIVHAAAKRVGNSLAVFLPAAAARQAGIREGDALTVSVELDVPEPFGLAKRMGIDLARYRRRSDDEMTHDRA